MRLLREKRGLCSVVLTSCVIYAVEYFKMLHSRYVLVDIQTQSIHSVALQIWMLFNVLLYPGSQFITSANLPSDQIGLSRFTISNGQPILFEIIGGHGDLLRFITIKEKSSSCSFHTVHTGSRITCVTRSLSTLVKPSKTKVIQIPCITVEYYYNCKL